MAPNLCQMSCSQLRVKVIKQFIGNKAKSGSVPHTSPSSFCASMSLVPPRRFVASRMKTPPCARACSSKLRSDILLGPPSRWEEIGGICDMRVLDQETWRRHYLDFKQHASETRGGKLLADYRNMHNVDPSSRLPSIVSMEEDKKWAKELKFEEAMCVCAWLDSKGYHADRVAREEGRSKRTFVTWTPEEDQLFLSLKRKDATLTFAHIASQLAGNKSRIDCKNRWKKLKRKLE